MWYGLTADSLVLVHFGFIVFVVLGGLLVLWRVWVAWLHIPAVIWGALSEFRQLICPLTPVENELRLAAGRLAYPESFVEHYLVPVVYPSGLTPALHVVLGVAVVAINVGVYAVVAARRFVGRSGSERRRL